VSREAQMNSVMNSFLDEMNGLECDGQMFLLSILASSMSFEHC
jgi:hypothetical protein